MDAKIFRVNYKSDFILTLTSDAGWMTPFCIKFWTGSPMLAYYASYDGETYTHCTYDPSEPTKLTVQFDDHHLPIGDLKYQVAYHFTVADFPENTEDEVTNQANVTTVIDGDTYQVMLDLNGETAPEIQFALPAYANELQRIQNEQTRIAQEQQRIAQEQQRISQEAARVTEFNGIKAEALADHQRANEDHSRATSDHQNALADRSQAASDHSRAQSDHSTASSDHSQAASDHSRAQSDHTTALSDHQTALSDHTQANTDHTRAESDHTRATADSSTAAADHRTASTDHTQANTDHARAESDHQRVETDLAEVEEFSNSLGAYDISAANATGSTLATYPDLATALGTNGSNIPEALRKGGMSVKFVQSSDNKYVQYRLMASEWSNNVNDWQGVDEMPVPGSKNFVESGGVYGALEDFDKKIYGRIDFAKYTIAGLWILSTNKWSTSSTGYKSCIVPLGRSSNIKIKTGENACLYGLLADDSHRNGYSVNYAVGESRETLSANSEVSRVVPQDARFLWVSIESEVGTGNRTPEYIVDTDAYNSSLEKHIDDLDVSVEELGSSLDDAVDDIEEDIAGVVKKINFSDNKLYYISGEYYEGGGSVRIDQLYITDIENKLVKTIDVNSTFGPNFGGGGVNFFLVLGENDTLRVSIPSAVTDSDVILIWWRVASNYPYICSGKLFDDFTKKNTELDIVKNSISKISAEVDGSIPYSNYAIKGLWISSGYYSLNYDYRSALVPLTGISNLVLTAKDSNGFYYALLTDNYFNHGRSVPFVSGGSRIHVNAGEIVSVSVPASANFLWVSMNTASADASPLSVVNADVVPITQQVKATEKSKYLFYANFKNGQYSESDFINFHGTITSGVGNILPTGLANRITTVKQIVLDEWDFIVDITTANNTERICITSELTQEGSTQAIPLFEVNFNNASINLYYCSSTMIDPGTATRIEYTTGISDIINGNIYSIMLSRHEGKIIGTIINRKTGAKATVIGPQHEEDDSSHGNNSTGRFYDNPSVFVYSGAPYIESIYASCNVSPKVLFIGDSITQGAHNMYNESWAIMSASYFGNSLTAGRGSARISCTKNQLLCLLSTISPKAVVVTIGTNETSSSKTKDDIKQELSELVDIIKQNGAIPIINNVCNSTARYSAMTKVNQAIDELGEIGAKFNLVTSINNDWSQGANTSLLWSDGVHLSVAGNAALYNYFIAAFSWLKDI